MLRVLLLVALALFTFLEAGCNRRTMSLMRAARAVKNNKHADENTPLDKGITAYADGKHAQAIKHFDEAIRKEPRNADIYHLRALCYLELNKCDQAVQDWAKAIELNPKDYTFPIERARCYAKMKQFKKAEADLLFAAKMDEDEWDAINELAWIYATSTDATFRNSKRAIELAKKACEMSKYQDDIPVDTLAASYAEAGQFTEAVKWQKEALRLAKQDDATAEELQKMRDRLIKYQSNQPHRDVQ